MFQETCSLHRSTRIISASAHKVAIRASGQTRVAGLVEIGYAIAMCKHCMDIALLFVALTVQAAFAKVIEIGVVQTVIEDALDKNRNNLLNFIGKAKTEGCQVVVFPEGALYWSDIAAHTPTKAELDSAIAQLGKKADLENICVVFGVGYRQSESGPYRNRGVVYDPNGRRLIFYEKNAEVPPRFYVQGIPFNLVVCSDRGYLEHSDLPCLVQGSQVIIDISGGHGGDDGRPDLRWIRYRPWALRTNVYVIVSNPVHEDVDFMGHSPWGGGSAVIRPDGSIQARRTYEKNTLIVEEIDTNLATRAEARRRTHLIFKPFWDMGEKLLEGETADSNPDIAPYRSAERNIKIAAVQMACSGDIGKNVGKIKGYIRRAAGQEAHIVVFPELAVTGCRKENITAAGLSALDSALRELCEEADSANIYVIVGMPYPASGRTTNCAFAIGDDGSIKTRYVQLAASRGMYLHFHIANQAYSSGDEAILAKQRRLLMLMYAKFGAVVNAAAPTDVPSPDVPAGGMSMIVSREGGHNKPAPNGLEYYLPYQTSIVKSAGSTETMICAARKTSTRNDMDLTGYWRNQNRRNRAQSGWYEWMETGALLID